MLAPTSAVTAASSHNTTTSSPHSANIIPTSPSRLGRLRGFSVLRSYTHDRLPTSRSDAPSLVRSTSSPNASTLSTRTQAPPVPTPAANSATADSTTPTTEGMSSLSISAASPARNRAATTTATPQQPANSKAEQQPTIRFIPHVEARSSRPSLHFAAISKTLKDPNGIVRVGRYSDREQASEPPGSRVLPVGFKSKVVSRRHCEFWCTNGQWYVKDVKSSSGTFLNHVRLSSPNVESRPYPVNDGDVVQLGIDFKGGEEVIFRCVKIRIECNRGWQKGLNDFNTSTHKKLLRSVAAAGAGKSKRDSDAASVSGNLECSICLNPVTPCQCLFVAPCSHVWHYKCVRSIVHGPNWPNFLCPNCRFVADLDADVEPPEEDLYEEEESNHDENEGNSGDAEHTGSSGSSDEALAGASNDDHMEGVMSTSSAISSEHDTSQEVNSSATSSALPVRSTKSPLKRSASQEAVSAGSASNPHTRFALAVGGVGDMNLLTPRNEAGPFVLDGAAGRTGRATVDEIVSQTIEENEAS